MNMDELCLRIEAVFPGVSIGPGRSQIGVRADFTSPVDLIENGVEIIGFEVWTTDTPLMVWSDVVDEDVLLEVVIPVEREIRHRIEGVSAHQLIAARRRPVGAAP